MDINKQIEEMAKIICPSYGNERDCKTCPNSWCFAEEHSTSLFCNGYRNASDVINEFSEELIKRFNDLEYNANTSRKTIKVDELREQMDWILHEVVTKTIKEFAEKYVEAMK